MFHCNFQVVRHSCRQPGRLRMGLQHPPVLRGKPRERLVEVGIERRHTHHAHELQRGRGVHGTTNLVDEPRRADVHAAA